LPRKARISRAKKQIARKSPAAACGTPAAVPHFQKKKCIEKHSSGLIPAF
jgi:hypothetical protein